MAMIEIKNAEGVVTGTRPMTQRERIETELPQREDQVLDREAIIARYEGMVVDIDANYEGDPDMATHRARLVSLIADETVQMKMEVLVRDSLLREQATLLPE